jgi:hypothetical protein
MEDGHLAGDRRLLEVQEELILFLTFRLKTTTLMNVTTYLAENKN